MYYAPISRLSFTPRWLPHRTPLLRRPRDHLPRSHHHGFPLHRIRKKHHSLTCLPVLKYNSQEEPLLHSIPQSTPRSSLHIVLARRPIPPKSGLQPVSQFHLQMLTPR
jgi:hypothetical protein